VIICDLLAVEGELDSELIIMLLLSSGCQDDFGLKPMDLQLALRLGQVHWGQLNHYP